MGRSRDHELTARHWQVLNKRQMVQLGHIGLILSRWCQNKF